MNPLITENKGAILKRLILVDLQDLLHRKLDLITETSLHPKVSIQILKEAQSL